MVCLCGLAQADEGSDAGGVDEGDVAQIDAEGVYGWIGECPDALFSMLVTL